MALGERVAMGAIMFMDTDAALAVVDLALRYGFIDRMDQAIAGLRRLGWVPEPMDGTGTCLDTTWQYPPSNNMWRVRTGHTDDEFYIGLSVNTAVDAAGVDGNTCSRLQRSAHRAHIRSPSTATRG